MPRCRSGECFAHNSENLPGDWAFFGCTRRCSYTGGGVLLQPDTLSANTGPHTHGKTQPERDAQTGNRRPGSYFAPVVVCPITVVMVTLRVFLALLILWTEKQTDGQTAWSETCPNV